MAESSRRLNFETVGTTSVYSIVLYSLFLLTILVALQKHPLVPYWNIDHGHLFMWKTRINWSHIIYCTCAFIIFMKYYRKDSRVLFDIFFSSDFFIHENKFLISTDMRI